MKVYLQLFCAAILFSMIMWFIAFQYNPNRFCKDHPDPVKKDYVYICKPFDFELTKGVLDRPNTRPPWEEKQNRSRKRINNREQRCDPNYHKLSNEDKKKYYRVYCE